MSITVLLIIFSKEASQNSIIPLILKILISIFASIYGGIIINKWLNITEGKILITKGKSAIRSLTLLLNNIAAMENRIRLYLKRHISKKKDKEIIKIYLEEIVDKCNILEEETLNSIENWTDIIPEANIKSQIGIITKQKQLVYQKEDQLKELEKKLKKESGTEKAKYEKQIKEKEDEISELSEELIKKEQRINDSVLGSLSKTYLSSTGSLPSFSPFPANLLDNKICKTCGRDYSNDPRVNITYRHSNLCPDCAEKL